MLKVKCSFTTRFEYTGNTLNYDTHIVYEPLYFVKGRVIPMSRFRIEILLRYLKVKAVILKMIDCLDFNSYLK